MKAFLVVLIFAAGLTWGAVADQLFQRYHAHEVECPTPIRVAPPRTDRIYMTGV